MKMPNLYAELVYRERGLRLRIPLDDKHFHYFTINDIKRCMKDFGRILDFTLVAGTNAAFISCQL